MKKKPKKKVNSAKGFGESMRIVDPSLNCGYIKIDPPIVLRSVIKNKVPSDDEIKKAFNILTSGKEFRHVINKKDITDHEFEMAENLLILLKPYITKEPKEFTIKVIAFGNTKTDKYTIYDMSIKSKKAS